MPNALFKPKLGDRSRVFGFIVYFFVFLELLCNSRIWNLESGILNKSQESQESQKKSQGGAKPCDSP